MMKDSRLNLDLFTRAHDDFENRQYIILAELKKISTEFQHYKIYPHLSELVKIHRTLKNVISRLTDLRNQFPKRIGKIDWVNQRIENEVVFMDGTDLSAVEGLITWALPKIEQVINEGITIHEYVALYAYLQVASSRQLHSLPESIFPSFHDGVWYCNRLPLSCCNTLADERFPVTRESSIHS